MPDEDFTSIEAALRVVEKFASRLTVGDAEGHVRRSVDELCAAVTKKEGIEPAVDRLLGGLGGLDDARAARRHRDFGREAPAVDRLLDAVQGKCGVVVAWSSATPVLNTHAIGIEEDLIDERFNSSDGCSGPA